MSRVQLPVIWLQRQPIRVPGTMHWGYDSVQYDVLAFTSPEPNIAPIAHWLWWMYARPSRRRRTVVVAGHKCSTVWLDDAPL